MVPALNSKDMIFETTIMSAPRAQKKPSRLGRPMGLIVSHRPVFPPENRYFPIPIYTESSHETPPISRIFSAIKRAINTGRPYFRSLLSIFIFSAIRFKYVFLFTSPMNTVTDTILWIIYILLMYLNIFWLIVYFLDGDKWVPKKRPKDEPKVSLVIPAHNEEKVIASTMEHAIAIDYPRNKYEIIVAVNASTDDTVKIARRIKKEYKQTNIKIISTREKGKGIALNRALKIVKGDFFVLLDADSYAEPKALKKLLPYFREDSSIACVLPMMKVAAPKNFLQKLQRHEYILSIFFKRIMGNLDCVHVAPGPFSVYRTEILRRLGGFSHPNLTEDLEITLKLHKHHYRVIQTTDAEVRTIAPEGLKDLYKQRNRWYKGSIFNSVSKDYRKMWFNREYGDFGFIQMPTIIVPGFLAVIMFSIYTYYFLEKAYDAIFRIYAINFDLPTVVSNLNLGFNLLDGDYTKLLIAALMLFLGAITFILSHRMVNEKVFRYGKLTTLVFLLMYPFFLAFVWSAIVIEIIFSRVQEW